MQSTQKIAVLMLALIVLCTGMITHSQAAAGQQPTLFFTALSDIPAMNGLIELEDYTLVYDKPEGRIIEMVARLEGQSIENVRQYYKSTLPELGWRVVNDNLYARGAENLSLGYETRNGQSYVRFTIQPQ